MNHTTPETEWRAEEYLPGVAWRVICDDGHYEEIIADELTEDQARLIAAAPAMDKALLHALGCLRALKDNMPEAFEKGVFLDTEAQVIAALEKAGSLSAGQFEAGRAPE